jgi:hypothetical protein
LLTVSVSMMRVRVVGWIERRVEVFFEVVIPLDVRKTARNVQIRYQLWSDMTIAQYVTYELIIRSSRKAQAPFTTAKYYLVQ